MQAAMLNAIPITYAWKGVKYLFPAGLLLIGICTLTGYLEGVLTILITGYAAVASTIIKTPKRRNRFAVASIVFLLLTWLVPVKTLLYLALAFALFSWIEMNGAAMHPLGVAALLLSSPAFYFTTQVFSFPIRLELTKIVGWLFSFFGNNVQLKGNIIIYKGAEFAVDPACMGLHMLSISMLLGILLIGLLQKKAGKIIGWKESALFLLCLFVLNLVANILRIILLVQFAIPPGNFMHDVVGLVCLLLYVIIPACFLAKSLIVKATPIKQQINPAFTTKTSLPLQVFLFAGLALIAVRVVGSDTYAVFQNNYKQTVSGYNTSVFAPGIVKLQNEKALVYIKYIRGFYDTEHNPAFCWKGSGYEFKNVQKKFIGGKEVYTAILSKNNQQLHTAWWYGNEVFSTTSQWEWRLSMIKTNANYALLNVTASSEELLADEIKQLVNKQTLKPFFTKSLKQ